MKISAIVAVSQNGIIGKNGHLPWHLSADLKRFKALTSGHTILLGRKNYGDIGRPLPNRTNIVLTRDASFSAPGCTVCHTLAEALDFARKAGEPELFIIGGAQIYAQALPLADRFYLTRVFRAYEGDTHFPEWDEAQWRLLSSESFASGANYPYPFAFETYERRRN